MIEIDRFHWNLARFFYGIVTMFCILGILCNFLIIFITIKTKSLRATCNVLIAICAVGDILHQCGVLVQSPLVFDIFLEMDSSTCLIFMFLPEMGIAIGCGGILCVGLDRMLSVIFAIRYQSIDKRVYYPFIASLIVACCACLSYIMIEFYRTVCKRVVCEVVAVYPDEGINLFTYALITVNAATVVVYLITWLGLRSQPDSEMMKRIVKSLFAIATIDVSGWILTPGLFVVYEWLELDELQMFAWHKFSVIFINLALSSKLFIYYNMSCEYRSAFKSLFSKRAKQSTISIQPMNKRSLS